LKGPCNSSKLDSLSDSKGILTVRQALYLN
jgi:hypothetical protein